MAQHHLFTVATPLPKVQIIYNFISELEEAYLLSKVDDVGGPTGEGEDIVKKAGGWKDLNGRRSMYWGGLVSDKQTLLPTSFPAFMDASFPHILNRIANLGVFGIEVEDGKGKGKMKSPNHCLVNEYLPGQGIMPHTDGPAYDPTVATLSLGTHTILTLRPRSSSPSPSTPSSSDATTSSESVLTPPEQTLSILLPQRSLIILSEEIYSDYLHGIEAIKFDSMDSLSACANWESYWETGAVFDGFIGVEPSSSDDEAGPDKSEERRSLEDKEVARVGKEEAIKELVARRRLVESGQGWERGRRVSLTCRRVGKVRKGIRIG